MNKARARIERLALRAAIRSQSFLARLRHEELGQSSWVNELMVLGIVVIIAALVFAFWKAGGATWVNSRLNDLTTY